jgi:general secretion pathway protein K
MIIAKQKGAALLAVLVVAVIMVVLMGVASTMLESRLVMAQDSKQRFQDLALVYAKQNELIYLLATQRVTAAGVSKGHNAKGSLKGIEDNWLFPIIGDEIRADGYVNKETSGLTYSIQNQDGLIPINSAGQYWLNVWLKAKGENSRARAKYSDSLADYQDPDDLRRAAGAEKGDYSKSTTPEAKSSFQPANFLLQNCNELWEISGWDTLLIEFPSFISYCGLRRGIDINLNVVPISLWQLLWPNSVEQVTELRQQNKWFLSDSSILAAEPSFQNLTDDYYSYLGGVSFRIKVQLKHIHADVRLDRGRGRVHPYTIRQ